MSDQANEQSVMERLTAHMTQLTGVTDENTEVADAPPEAEATADELAEIEWGERKYKVPPELKDAFMKNADYTQKTQALAEERKRIEHVRTLAEQAQAQQAFTQAVQAEQQELAVIEAYLSQAGKADWSQMSTEQMLRMKVELDTVKERRDALKSVIAEKRSKFDDDLKGRLVELRGKAREMASKSITGFSEETEKAVRSYASAEGLSDHEIDNVLLDPRSFKILWKAAQYEKVQANVGKATAAAEKVVKPGAATDRMPKSTADKLNFNKAMKQAKTSGEKAQVIEGRLARVFGG